MQYILRSSIASAVLVAVLAACTHQQKSSSVKTESNDSDSVRAIKLTIDISDAKPISNSLDIAKRIVLNEEVENVMGLPQSIEIRGDTIFAVDSYQAPGIYAYLTDGTQLWSYCSEGGAEEDVSSPFNINVTAAGVHVYDMSAKKIVTLDKKGRFVNMAHAHPDTHNVIVDENGAIWSDYSNQEYASTLLSYRETSDDNEVEILTVPEILKGLTIVGLRSLTPLEDGSINYLPAVEPKVYSLLDGKATLKYELDFGSLWPDDRTIKENFTGDSWARNFRNFPIQRLNVKESPRWVSVFFETGGQSYVYLYDKTTSKGGSYVDTEKEYFVPLYLAEDMLYMQSKDNSIVALSCK